jgi:hypothetical protein
MMFLPLIRIVIDNRIDNITAGVIDIYYFIHVVGDLIDIFFYILSLAGLDANFSRKASGENSALKRYHQLANTI